eukprot:scaffold2480_cov63-Skeletonema_menzelii.AAC.1
MEANQGIETAVVEVAVEEVNALAKFLYVDGIIGQWNRSCSCIWRQWGRQLKLLHCIRWTWWQIK